MLERFLKRSEPNLETAPPTPLENMCLCPDCTSDLVQPVAWEETDRDHWEVSLRCPNCEWTTTGIYDENTVQRYDAALDRGMERMEGYLRYLTRHNMLLAGMVEDVERFEAAIEAGHVLPEDLGRIL